MNDPHVELVSYWTRPFDPAEVVVYSIDLQKELAPKSDTIDSVAWSVSSEGAAVNLEAADATGGDDYVASATISFTSTPATEAVHNKVFDVIADVTTTGGSIIRRVRRLTVRVADSSESRKYTLLQLAEVKTWLNLKDDEHDWALLDLERRVSAYIEKATGRTIVGPERDIIEYHCGQGKFNGVWLFNEPVDDFASYTVEKREGINEDWEDISSESFEVHGRELWRKEARWPLASFPNVRVTYRAGFEDPPYDLKALALEICGKSFKERQTITPAAVVGQETIIPLRVPTTSQATLDAWRTRPMYGIGR